MRPKRRLRSSRPVRVAAGALTLTTGASAVALAAGQAHTQRAIQIKSSSRHVAFGDDLKVSGTASGIAPGQKLLLQFVPSDGGGWQTLASTRLRADGHFRFAAPAHESGHVRVVQPSSGRVAAASDTPSGWRAVTVGSELRIRAGSFNVLAGHSIELHGRLLPEIGGRKLELLGRSGHGWHALARTRTRRWGGFRLHYNPGSTGRQSLRVRFSGDRLSTKSSRYAGRLTAYRQSVASWYDDGGATACGDHAYYGVANRTLPCGTHVTFRYGGRSVTAVVDDRGPYVGGRDWDLNQNTAGALGFSGVDTVWSTR